MSDVAGDIGRARSASDGWTLARSHLGRIAVLSASDRAVLAKTPTTPRTLSRGEDLIREGDSTDNLYVLVSGWMARHAATLAGGRSVSALLVPGALCNLDTLTFGRANCGIRALTAATVMALPRERALGLIEANPGIGRAFTAVALAETAILQQWALGLGRRSAAARLAHLLCELSVRLDAAVSDGESRFDLPLTQETIADMLGLTPVHVNRTLQQLRAAGLVVTAGRAVVLPDMPRLRCLAEFDPAYLHETDRVPNPVAA